MTDPHEAFEAYEAARARAQSVTDEEAAARPMQKIVWVDKIIRFRANAIVRMLLDEGPFAMNAIAMRDFSQEDEEQFAQLIGYSVSVNPNHLEPVTHVENMRRGTGPVSTNMHKTHCKRGHEFPVGPHTLPVGERRYCVPCKLERQRKAYVPRPRPPQTHCKRGHEFNEENTGRGNGRRRCRKCARDQVREAYRNKKRKDAKND